MENNSAASDRNQYWKAIWAQLGATPVIGILAALVLFEYANPSLALIMLVVGGFALFIHYLSRKYVWGDSATITEESDGMPLRKRRGLRPETLQTVVSMMHHEPLTREAILMQSRDTPPSTVREYSHYLPLGIANRWKPLMYSALVASKGAMIYLSAYAMHAITYCLPHSNTWDLTIIRGCVMYVGSLSLSIGFSFFSHRVRRCLSMATPILYSGGLVLWSLYGTPAELNMPGLEVLDPAGIGLAAGVMLLFMNTSNRERDVYTLFSRNRHFGSLLAHRTTAVMKLLVVGAVACNLNVGGVTMLSGLFAEQASLTTGALIARICWCSALMTDICAHSIDLGRLGRDFYPNSATFNILEVVVTSACVIAAPITLLVSDNLSLETLWSLILYMGIPAVSLSSVLPTLWATVCRCHCRVPYRSILKGLMISLLIGSLLILPIGPIIGSYFLPVNNADGPLALRPHTIPSILPANNSIETTVSNSLENFKSTEQVTAESSRPITTAEPTKPYTVRHSLYWRKKYVENEPNMPISHLNQAKCIPPTFDQLFDKPRIIRTGEHKYTFYLKLSPLTDRVWNIDIDTSNFENNGEATYTKELLSLKDTVKSFLEGAVKYFDVNDKSIYPIYDYSLHNGNVTMYAIFAPNNGIRVDFTTDEEEVANLQIKWQHPERIFKMMGINVPDSTTTTPSSQVPTTTEDGKLLTCETTVDILRHYCFPPVFIGKGKFATVLFAEAYDKNVFIQDGRTYGDEYLNHPVCDAPQKLAPAGSVENQIEGTRVCSGVNPAELVEQIVDKAYSSPSSGSNMPKCIVYNNHRDIYVMKAKIGKKAFLIHFMPYEVDRRADPAEFDIFMEEKGDRWA